MTDLSTTIDPKSDQLNADDLISGPRTIRVTGVKGSSGDQPISIYFEGDNGKPYKPCKSMRRVLVMTWGKDGNSYAGKSMTLYCDPEVTFGGIKVGGIRISHLSDIDADTSLMLTTTRAKKAPYKVRKLVSAQKPASTEKPKGNIESARTMLEGADSQTVATILKGLRGQSWTKEEGQEIKKLGDAAEKRKPPTTTEEEGDF